LAQRHYFSKPCAPAAAEVPDRAPTETAGISSLAALASSFSNICSSPKHDLQQFHALLSDEHLGIIKKMGC